MLSRNTETFIGCDREYCDADIALFGAPFDSTTSYRPGARFGCKAMRSESFGLETYSPYLDRDLGDIRVFDAGDLELCFGDASLALKRIEEFTAGLLADGKKPVMLGGEHLVTLGAVRAIVASGRYPELCVVHFDAHADLRDDYLGAKLSHAAVLRRCHELTGDGRIFQFGIRSGDRSEYEFARSHTYMEKFTADTVGECVRRLSGRPFYLTVDLDALDPSVLPGTGTPEAGGLTFDALRKAVCAFAELGPVGCDIVELAPAYDPSGVSTAVACKLLRELLLSLA